MEKQFKELRDLINTAAACTKPDDQTFQSLLVPFHSTIEAINRLKEANRKDRDWFTHLMVISEASTFVAWVLNVCFYPLSPVHPLSMPHRPSPDLTSQSARSKPCITETE